MHSFQSESRTTAPPGTARSGAPQTQRYIYMKVCLLLLLAAGSAAADDSCGSATKCGDCAAGCTWINRWDSTGWHCIDDSKVDKDNMLVMEYTDCSSCAVDPDTHYPPATCAKCNQRICGWCDGSWGGTCMTDSDKNSGICSSHSGTSWTGSMDDCP